ncbi:MAG TPA: NUDIX hydrolase [Pyrinomonadaceae bacterium]|jgi:8-oxo-dGTP pyrophosphatase MutT (NUDIX family)
MTRKHGPWTIKERVEKYSNELIEVREDQVIQPDGKPGTYATVKIKEGISVLALDADGFVHLVKEFRYALGSESIETVSGAIDEGESFEAAARRELREELGIEAKQLTSLGRFDPSTSMIDSPAHLFLARDLSFKEQQTEATETIKPVKMKLEQAVRMVLQSEITAGVSCVLILRADYYLKS